jgi:hypothetical protein
MGAMNQKRPTAIIGSMNHAKHHSTQRYLLVQSLAWFNISTATVHALLDITPMLHAAMQS